MRRYPRPEPAGPEAAALRLQLLATAQPPFGPDQQHGAAQAGRHGGKRLGRLRQQHEPQFGAAGGAGLGEVPDGLDLRDAISPTLFTGGDGHGAPVLRAALRGLRDRAAPR